MLFFSLVCLPFLLSACSLFSLPFFFCSFFYSFVVFCAFIYSMVPASFVYSFLRSFIRPFVCIFLSLLVYLFVISFARSFVCSFARSFVVRLFIHCFSFVCHFSPTNACVFLYFLFAFFSLVCLLAGSFFHLLLCSFARSFVFCLIVFSFIRSFIVYSLFFVLRQCFRLFVGLSFFFVFYFLQTSVFSCFVFFMFVFSLVCVLAHSFVYLLRSFFSICSFSEEHYLLVMEDPNKTESMSGWDKKQFVYLKL